MDIVLDHLTEAEQDAIYAVLRRDDQLRTKEHERIRQLQNDVKKIKLAGVIKPGVDANKTCARCRKEFGWIFNKGQVCPNCQHKVCENCKATLKDGLWLCVLCQKQREIEAMSGQWFYKKFRKSKRNKKTNQVVSGNEIIRASIRKKPMPPRHGRMRNSEFEARTPGRRTVSPSSLVLGSDGGAEDSDTQSTEMGPTTQRHHRRPDLAFPKDSDQARLQNLITSGTLASNPQGATRRVITVGGMGRDSSSSDSEPGSPALPKSKKSPFNHDDSVQSSGRSASPVSAISSEGHMTMVTERDISDIESLRSAVSGIEDFESKRSSDNLHAEAAAPPRRLAKTAEQERLEALQEKSQEDLAGHSDSDGLVPPSRVKRIPGVGGAPPVVASNPYDRLRATNPLSSDTHTHSLTSNTAVHAALASSTHKKSLNSGHHPTKTPHRTLTDATLHANSRKITPIPIPRKHPHGFVKPNIAPQHSSQSSKSSAKCQAFMESQDIDVMYQHYAQNLHETYSSTSSDSDVESQDGYSLTSRDADVESLDSHKESHDSHTPRESLEFGTPRGSLEYHTPRESLELPSDLDVKDAQVQQELQVIHAQNAKDNSPHESATATSSSKRPLQLAVNPVHIQEPVQDFLSSSSSSLDSSEELTPSSPCWHPAWAAAMATDPRSTKIQKDRDDNTRQSNVDHSHHKHNASISDVPPKAFNPFDVIVHDDVKYTSDQVLLESSSHKTMELEKYPEWEDLKTRRVRVSPHPTSELAHVKDKSPKSPLSEYREANLLDDDDNDYLFDDDMPSSSSSSLETVPYLPSYWQSVPHKEDDDGVSDTLSVITEVTEPVDSDKSFSDEEFNKSLDNTVMELVEFKMLTPHSPREQGLQNTHKAWLRTYRSMSLTSTLAYNECVAVSGDSDAASLTDLLKANQGDNDLDFTAVYELNSSAADTVSHTKETAQRASPVKASVTDASRLENLRTVPETSDAKPEDSPTSVKDAVRSWESKRPLENKSYLGNEIDWSQVYEIDMVEEEDESDATASDSGLPASLDVQSAEERNMKRVGADVDSDETSAKMFKASEHSFVVSVAGNVNSIPPDTVTRDSRGTINGEVTPTNSASSSDSVITPRQSETAAARQEALQELRSNISIALKRLSDSPHEEEFQFEKSSDEEDYYQRKHDVSPEDNRISSTAVTSVNVMRNMNRNSLDELAEEYEQVPPPVKLREQLMRNANRNTLDYLAEENEMEEEKEIDLDDIIQENTYGMAVASESSQHNVDTWTTSQTVKAQYSESDTDSDESLLDQNETVIEAKEISVSVPNIVTSFVWEKLDQSPTAKEAPMQLEKEDESPSQESVSIESGDDSYETSPVIKRQHGDKTDSLKGSRHRKMYVIDTEQRIVVPGLNSDEESDSLNEQSSSNRSSTIASGDSDPQVVVKVEDTDAQLMHDTDTAIAAVAADDTANMYSAINSDTKTQAPQPTFLKLVQSHFGFGTDSDTPKKSVSFNPYTEEYSDGSDNHDKSSDTSFSEPVAEVAVTALIAHAALEEEKATDSDGDLPDQKTSVKALEKEKAPDSGSDSDSDSDKNDIPETSVKTLENENASHINEDDLPNQKTRALSSDSDKSSNHEGSVHSDDYDDVAIVSQTVLEKQESSDDEPYEIPDQKESILNFEYESSSQNISVSYDQRDEQSDQDDLVEPQPKSRSQSSESDSSSRLDKSVSDDRTDQFEPRDKSDSQSSVEELNNAVLHETSDTASKTDSESVTDLENKSEHPVGHGRVLVRQEIYVDSDSDGRDLSKSDSRESEGMERSAVAAASHDGDDDDSDSHDESVSAGAAGIEPLYATVNKKTQKSVSISSRSTDDEQRPRKESKDDGDGDSDKDAAKADEGMDDLAGSMAAMGADAMRDAGCDESNDGLVRDAVPESPVASVTDDPSANPDRKRGDSTLSEGDLSMSSSELTNIAPPTTSPSGSMNPDDRVDDASAREANGGVMPGITITEAPKEESLERRSKTSAMSEDGSLVEPHFDDEDEEDIDELFTSAAMNRSITNLNSTYSESRESIASYYSDAGEGSKYPVTGDIEFGAHYNYKTGIFEVLVKKCRNIAAVDAKRKRTDAYVKAYLLPDKSRAGKRKTKVKKHTINPVFDEILRFSITKSELESRTLSLSVWHNDRFGRNDFLGEVALPLDNMHIDSLKPDWYPLLDRVLPLSPTSVVTYKGDLLISLKFKQDDPSKPGTLEVLVKEARNLTPKDNGASDPFCKGYLLPDKASKQSKQKTAVKKKTVNPIWDQTLTFSGVSLSDLSQRSLELTVWDHDRFNRNDFLGGVRLNLGTGKSEGQNVDWMDAKGEEISLWQSMLHRPNVWIDSNLMLRPSMDKRP